MIDDIGDGDEDDECCEDNCDNVRAGKIIVISKLLLKRKLYLLIYLNSQDSILMAVSVQLLLKPFKII